MASAFSRLFLPSHRKRNANAAPSRRQDVPRSRFSTSSTTFDLRHSIPEESVSTTESTFSNLPSTSTLTVQQLNDQVSAPISDATLRRRSLAIEASRSYSSDTLRPSLPRSFSALDITSPLHPDIDADHAYAASSQVSLPPMNDDDDVDTNPLYLELSERPHLARDWNMASLVLIPLARTLTPHHAVHQSDLLEPHFVALHAFAPSKLYKHQWVSVRSLAQSSSPEQTLPSSDDSYDWNHVTLTATIEADQKSVSITETMHTPQPSSIAGDGSPAAGSAPSMTTKRNISIVEETTIYRTLPVAIHDSVIDDSGFQVTSRTSASKDAPAPSTKVRVVSVKFPIVHRHSRNASVLSAENGSQSADTPDDEDLASISDLIVADIPSKRTFAADLAILSNPANPSYLLANALSNAFEVLFAGAHQFVASFVYVKGFDSYNAHRIRRGIWFKAWKAFEECLGSEQISRLSVEAFHRIKSLLESVVMGLVHTKMYGPIQDQLLDADLVTDEVLGAYCTFNVTLADLGVENAALKQRPDRLAGAIDALSQGLCDDGGPGIDEALSTGDLQLLKSFVHDVSPSTSPQAEFSERIHNELGLGLPDSQADAAAGTPAELHRRTPLQILQTLRAVIDEIGWAAERPHQSSNRASFSSSYERPPPLGTDDLLPILSYVFVRARPSRLCSMLYYARAFHLTDSATSPDLQWALVTCDAVIAYLRSDPLRVCRRRSSSSLSFEPARKASQSRSGPGSLNDSHLVRSWSSRSQQSSAATSTLQAAQHMSRFPSDSASPLEPSPPQSPRASFHSIGMSTEHTSASNSYIRRHGDEHGTYASSEASPRTSTEGFKLPGLPASSRRNSRTLQQRPNSIFSLRSDDGDTASLGPDTSLDALDRRLSAAATQSPSRRLGMRDRTLSSSSNDVQIRPQIVRTIKRSQAGTMNGGNRLERTSSNGSTASSSNIHVRVVGSPSIRPVDNPTAVSSGPPKPDRRRSLDAWTAFSFLSLDPTQDETASSSSKPTASSTATDAMALQADSAESVTALPEAPAIARSTSWLSWGAEAHNNSGSRRNSISATTISNLPPAVISRGPSATPVITPESIDTNCQPEGVEALHVRARTQTTASATSAAVTFPPLEGDSNPSSVRSTKGRYRVRLLSTSSATLAAPQIDKGAMSAVDVARPRATHRKSLGSLDALRATIGGDGPVGREVLTERDVNREPSVEGVRKSGAGPLFQQLQVPSPVAEASTPTANEHTK